MRSDLHIVFIGLDGWGSYDLDNSFAHMPHIRHYAQKGLYTDNKKAVLPTKSAPNWASMFMGASPESHGFIKNSEVSSIEYPFAVKNDIFPTISQIIKNEIPKSEIGFFYQWRRLLYVVDEKSVDHICHIPLVNENSHDALTKSVIEYIKLAKPLLCTIVYDDPDYTGHKYGYYSNEYFSVLEHLDECVEKIVMAYKKEGLYKDAVFILTSDHGGNGKTHGGDSIKEIKTPFIMWGNGIKDLGYVNEGMEQKDLAVMMASILNLDTPKQWTGNNHQFYSK